MSLAIRHLSILTLSLALPHWVDAATTSGTMPVTATVSSSCVVSTSAVAFGSYNPTGGSQLDGTGTVSVTCTKDTSYTVALDGGGQGAVASRAMLSGANLLTYQLYSDAARTTVWGDTAGQLVSGTGTGAQQDLTVFGRIPASQNVPSGAYADTINVTVTYN